MAVPTKELPIVLAACLLACQSSTSSPDPATQTPAAGAATPSPPAPGARPWVTGYYAGWFWDWHGVDEALAAVDMTAMTHFVFGRYAPGGGTLGGTPGRLVSGAGTGHQYVEDRFVARAHAAGIKALVMVGGAGDGPGFVASTAPSLRAGFVQSLLDLCVAKDYDGVDVNWEDTLASAQARSQNVALLTELRAAAAQRPRYQSRPFIITSPGFFVNTNTDTVEPWQAAIAAAVDQYNLMTYSMTWNCCGWDSWFFSALKGHAPTHPTSVESSIQRHVDAGIPRSKLGFGLGLYGSAYGPPISGPRQPLGSHHMWHDWPSRWSELYRAGLLGQESYRFDETAQTGYYSYSPPRAFQGSQVSMLTAEDARTIAAKGAWARAGNAGGVIVWTINYGYVDGAVGNPPLAAIKDAFLR